MKRYLISLSSILLLLLTDSPCLQRTRVPYETPPPADPLHQELLHVLISDPPSEENFNLFPVVLVRTRHLVTYSQLICE